MTEEISFAPPTLSSPIVFAKGTGNGGAPSLCIHIRNGEAGIELFPDGTSRTFGDYNPDETAREFFHLVAQAYKLDTPQGKA